MWSFVYKRIYSVCLSEPGLPDSVQFFSQFFRAEWNSNAGMYTFSLSIRQLMDIRDGSISSRCEDLSSEDKIAVQVSVS